MAPDKPNARPRKPGAEKAVDGSSKTQVDNGGPVDQDGPQEPREGAQERFPASGGPATPDPADPEPVDPTNPFKSADYRVADLDSDVYEEHVTEVTVRRPKKTEWIMVHPDPAYPTVILTHEVTEMTREHYLVLPALLPELAMDYDQHLRQVLLFRAVNRQGVEFVWDANRPNESATGRGSTAALRASRSALAAVKMATTTWTKVKWDDRQAQYTFTTTRAHREGRDLGKPKWSNKTFDELLELAFGNGDRIIRSMDHPVILEILGA